jgi:hypothetical protein
VGEFDANVGHIIPTLSDFDGEAVALWASRVPQFPWETLTGPFEITIEGPVVGECDGAVRTLHGWHPNWYRTH